MEHECTSRDGNGWCDLCNSWIAHNCSSKDGNDRCDLCGEVCEKEYLPGDVSGEGKVNMADVAKLYAHIKGTNVLTAENGLERCDITGEGKINMADVARLYAHIKGTNKLF
jgi:hypothetical protein